MATVIQYINGFYTGNNYLSQTEIDINAVWIHTYLSIEPTAWTSLESICALLGNMQQESTVNPGLWENRKQGNRQGGFGLVQWTPASKYLDWCTKQNLTPSYMDSNLMRLQYEMDNDLQWIPLRLYENISFREFAGNTEEWSLETLTRCFMRCYERPSEQGELIEQRQAYARHFYELLKDNPTPPDPPSPIGPDTPTPPGQYWFQNKWFIYMRKHHKRRRY